ncbi:hypothetical protein ACFL35_17005 [Candidatus Riflebacteria bacterium]
MAIIKLNQQLKRVEIKSFEIENETVFNFFNKLSTEERDDSLYRALYIGVLALMEDRISAFLAKTSNELGTEMESLKLLFDMKKELFFKTALKGMAAEEDIAEFLTDFLNHKKIKDTVFKTGSKPDGTIPRNKTGDIVCHIDGDPEKKIAIECKFDKGIKLGEIEEKNLFTKKMDTAWSQLLEAQANRDSKVSIIVFDNALVDKKILSEFECAGYIPGIGLVAIVDSQKGDFTGLAIAYMLARDIALNAKETTLDKDVLTLLIKRIIKDISEIFTIKKLITSNIENNKNILKQLDKSLLLIEFSWQYLQKFLNDGTLTKKDLLDFYMGEEVKEKFKLIEKEIEKEFMVEE